MSPEKRYSDEVILAMLRQCKDQQGVCTPRKFREYDQFCSVSCVMDRFDGWSNAKKAAGVEEDLSDDSGRKRQYTDEQILSHLRECQRRYGKCTTDTLQQDDDFVSPTVVVTRFGSWIEAKKEAGIDVDERNHNSRPREYSDEELLDMILECKRKYGKATQRIFNEKDEFPTSGAVRHRFGNWSTAKELAGLDTQNQDYSSEELLEMLRECAERHENCSAKKFAEDDDFCSPGTIQSRFGSWRRGKEEAGFDESSNDENSDL
ncbi:homing endonuclease associated repeat-containing protein [Haloplanus salinarum]|nr:hypothetical protein [Haloplanus salinarum]